jgi:ribosome-interacting GTPase 1
MASTNQSPFYQRAEQEFLNATTDEERLSCLNIMIKECPKHKSSENMLRNLTTRRKKLLTSIAKQKKSGKGGKKGIKKFDMQVCVVGFTNSGKTTLFNKLTSLNHLIAPTKFTTYEPGIGMVSYEDTQFQIIDMPAFPNQDKSTINSTDTIIQIVTSLDQIEKTEKEIWKSPAKRILIFNETGKTEKRKLEATLKSKYKNLAPRIINCLEPKKTDLEKLKKEIFETFPIIRVYTKEPKKEKSEKPMILKENSTVEEAAEKILKGMSKKIKKTRIWGPSSKFGGQGVGLKHQLKDKDTVEFTTE